MGNLWTKETSTYDKEKIISLIILGKLNSYVQKNETTTFFTPYTKIKWIKDLNIKPENSLKENRKQSLGHQAWQRFTRQVSGETKTNKLELHQNKKSAQQMKRQWKKTFAK